MIQNWDYKNLNIDFCKGMPRNDHPSDIDMIYLCKDNTLIIGEFKNERDHKDHDAQKRIIAKILDAHKYKAVGLFVKHNGYVQDGVKTIDGLKCDVYQIYVKGENEWRFPKHSITVKEVLDYYRKEKR